MARNAHFSYTADGANHSIDLYIEEMSQSFDLSGTTAQTRLHRQFFPRGYSPGNLSMTARATSQDEYQTFARFVRDHQVTMVNTPGHMAFTSLDTNSPGYQRLLRLYIDAEGILYRGWIPSFTMRKEGVMAPAPSFTVDFFVVFDSHATNIFASRQVQKLWWQQSAPPPIVISGNDVTKQPFTDSDMPGFDLINTLNQGNPFPNPSNLAP